MNFFLELKNRLLLVILSIIFTIVVAVTYKEFLVFSTTIPIIKSKSHMNIASIYFIYTTLTDIFDAYVAIILFIAFHSYIIIGLYQICSFLMPALYKIEQKIVKHFLFINFSSIIIAHVLLCNLIIPLTLIFFEKLHYSLEESGLIFYFENKINEYIIFYIHVYIITYITCLLILIFTIFFFYKSKKKKFINNHRKTIYVMFYVLVALITPPDLISQMIIFIIITSLFEFIVFVFVIYDRLVRKPIEAY